MTLKLYLMTALVVGTMVLTTACQQPLPPTGDDGGYLVEYYYLNSNGDTHVDEIQYTAADGAQRVLTDVELVSTPFPDDPNGVEWPGWSKRVRFAEFTRVTFSVDDTTVSPVYSGTVSAVNTAANTVTDVWASFLNGTPGDVLDDPLARGYLFRVVGESFRYPDGYIASKVDDTTIELNGINAGDVVAGDDYEIFHLFSVKMGYRNLETNVTYVDTYKPEKSVAVHRSVSGEVY
jgi:hypothetical protein